LEQLVRLISEVGSRNPPPSTSTDWAELVRAVGDALRVSEGTEASQAELLSAAAALTAAIARWVDRASQAPPVAIESAAPPVAAPPVLTAPTEVVKVKAAQSAVVVVRGKSLTVPASAYTASGARAKVTWKSSNPKIATVTASGKITGKKAGKATITATSANGKRATIKVSVLRAKPAKAKVTKVTAAGVPATMRVGQVAWITGKYAPARTASVKLTYTSSKPGIAAIDRMGRLVAKAPGTFVLTIKAAGRTTTKTITVAATP
jgi:uncharacterized protein YjdB